ncbi:hypothetical protein [Pedobacter sp. Hv1]|uniref:hypothetical protein n=1 Tax=Pedobacter sp. Hv1 TaxID=1740090 RepID=UPI0006D8D63F|nr:hypothetical protein [Pedobacter sp. Hv1]KQC00712.1 hypothetical protein AQF98_08515 [Pedobacter sp. Hv1]
MKSIDKLQNLLPLGYLFLVVLGIIKESVFFHQIGINILKYSSIMDVLISPIATLTLDPIILIIFTMMFICCVLVLPLILYRLRTKKWVEKAFDLNNIEPEPSEKVLKGIFTTTAIQIFAFMLLSFFLGFGIGQGAKTARNIKNNKLDYDYKLNYSSGESEDIYMVGSNSLYYFYLAKGNPAVKISPVGSIKSIELTKNRMLK